MSSISVAMVMLGTLAAVCRAEVSCPATVTVTEKIEARAGWTSRPVARQVSFLRASVLNYKAGLNDQAPSNGKAGIQEFDLAPDSTEHRKDGTLLQTWKLADYREMRLLLRCHYRDAAAVLELDLAADLKTCALQFRLNSAGNFVGPSKVICR